MGDDSSTSTFVELSSSVQRAFNKTRELLSEAQREHSALDTEISVTRQNLDNLLGRQSQGAERIEKLRAECNDILRADNAPHKKLPPELLGEIFMHCLDGNAVEVPWSSPSSMPWALGRVCSQWRKVMLKERRLWSDMRLRRGVSEVAVREVTSRSGSLAISLDTRTFQMSKTIFPILLGRQKRIRTLKLSINLLSSRRYLTQLSSFESLKALAIDYHLAWTSIGGPCIPSMDVPPALDELDLAVPSADDDNTCMYISAVGIYPEAFPWSQLSRLAISRDIIINLPDALTILRQCTKLMDCDISLQGRETIPPDSKPVTLPALKSVTVYPDRASLGALLDMLTLQSLEALTVDAGANTQWPQEELLRFIHRCGCCLARLSLKGNVIPVKFLIPLLRAVPDVVSFITDLDGIVTHAMLDTMRAEKLLPKLEELHLLVESTTPILELMESRWAGGSHRGIHKGAIYIPDDTFERDVEGNTRLKSALAERGADIIVSVPEYAVAKSTYAPIASLQC